MIEGYRLFLPAVFITWVLVEIAGPNVKGYGGYSGVVHSAQVGLFVVSYLFYAAAARKGAGGTDENVLWYALKRNSASVNGILMVCAVLFSTALSIGATLVLGVDPERLWIWYGAGAIDLLIVLWIIGRSWPAVVVPFHYSGYLSWSGAARGMMWVGAGYRVAWRLTSRLGAWRRASAPFMLWCFGVFAAYMLLRWQTVELPFLRFLTNLLFYAGAMPYVATLADEYTAMLKVEDERCLNQEAH